MTIAEWAEEQMEKVEGAVYISCVMREVPFHTNTSRYQVYNEEGTFSKLYDITVDDEGEIIIID